MPAGHLPVRSYLAVPVKSRSGEVIGGLFFGHSEVDVFTERAERLVVGVAAQAAVAIDNARMFEAAQKAAEDRKLLLDSERLARSAAERMSEMKDQFLATLSHELRTPLSAILGWAQVLRRGSKSEVDVQRGLETIERNARMQTKLIEDLLDMSRIASGKGAPRHAADASGRLRRGGDRDRAARGGCQEHRAHDHARHECGSDHRRSRPPQQVVEHPFRAIKFTPKDGRIDIAVRREALHVEIQITDTGIGIEPEFLAHLFRRFRQPMRR
jgi:signal transduction histidine kinase